MKYEEIKTSTEWCEWLAEQKHLMIAGASGSGKSVVLNQIIVFGIFGRRDFRDVPGGAQMILIDPKRVELVAYKDLPHTICHASEPTEMVLAIRKAVEITEQRYIQMAKKEQQLYEGSDVYLLIDEFADLMTTNRKQVQPLIQRLAQIGRAARVHIILCTQCPIAKVIPTEIKCNFDSIVGLHTARKQDSRNIIGCAGLEELPNYGKCWTLTPDSGKIVQWTVYPPHKEKYQEVISYWLKAYPKRKPGLLKRLFAS